MPLDPSIALQYKPFQAPSQTNALAQILQLQGAQQQNALVSGQLQDQQAVRGEKNAWRDLVAKGVDLSTPEGRQQANIAAPTLAPNLIEADLKTRQTQGLIDEQSLKIKRDKVAYNLQLLGGVNDPQAAVGWYQNGIKDGLITPERAQAELQALPQDAQGFAQWKQKQMVAGMDIKDQMGLLLPKLKELKTGQTTRMLDEAPLSPTFGKDLMPPVQMTADPNSVLQSKTSLATNAATNATSRANNAATIAKDYKVAGLDQNGNFVGGSEGTLGGLIDGVGTGKIPLGQATARMPPAVKAQLMDGLAQKYPDFDPTDMAQRNRAAVAFGTGKEGSAVRSFNVALSHLDTLSNLADALNNGNTQLINKIGNIYTQQSGSAAPTNFEAAKKIVTDEIVKAIVGSGGGVHDREEAAATISKASSPAQLKGAIDTYKELMRGQLGGLERQYKATTGRDDFSSKFLSPEAKGQEAIGATGSGGKKTVTRTGTLNGRKVVQYSDGTTDYAN